MITTNGNFEPVKESEPVKLGIRTTERIATKVSEPVTRGADLSKMITTHDERDVEDHSASNPAVNKAGKGKGKKSE